ncbi:MULTISPECIES: single-stranded DNA-binding protein [unclassified Pedobacter]|uniref:single-stranded DNA-binding protein n=1 Tax=unclassified Pedobacter TaxID=2628915 RepID=UPI000B4B8684|nr:MULTISPECIES: single-stranded DNA-binding protein [unclassified Pedobacter]MCX2431271.1 single-stranded DNA-binding protein [Pedobacter sp. GR22-10]MCX2585121.1 single-stranded DNA-binding protein [Pedobacter sp. MR22-3]OWK71678.1 single-stranded DNA-binding protein [Pedobacter sp. AJM]
MESAINKVVLSGFAGADAEVRNISGNQRLAKVNLAVNEYYKNASGEEVKKTNWFTLTFWNDKADLASAQIKKGTRLTIEGKLLSGSYVAKDGSKKFTTDIVVSEVAIKEIDLSN